MTNFVGSLQVSGKESLFDSIRRVDENGNEYWVARELMKNLGYQKWQNFHNGIKRASISCQNAGNIVTEHFLLTSVNNKSKGRPLEDWKLSRYACYLVAMNSDPEKSEIALAQSYFAIKTREAEVIIPQKSERLQELELLAEISRNTQLNTKYQSQMLLRTKSLGDIHGTDVLVLLLSGADKLVPVTVKTTETIVCMNGKTVSYEGVSTAQVGAKLGLKTGPTLVKWLYDHNAGHLVSKGSRVVPSEYIATEDIKEVYQIWAENKDRQLLIGE
jgi:hypothetical protein